jgi:hypothetical protein
MLLRIRAPSYAKQFVSALQEVMVCFLKIFVLSRIAIPDKPYTMPTYLIHPGQSRTSIDDGQLASQFLEELFGMMQSGWNVRSFEALHKDTYHPMWVG